MSSIENASIHVRVSQEIYRHHVDLINTVIPGEARKGPCFTRVEENITGAGVMYIVCVHFYKISDYLHSDEGYGSGDTIGILI